MFTAIENWYRHLIFASTYDPFASSLPNRLSFLNNLAKPMEPLATSCACVSQEFMVCLSFYNLSRITLSYVASLYFYILAIAELHMCNLNIIICDYH